MTRSARPIAALTGATGFLGAHLVRALDEAGFQVRVLARRAPSPPGWGEVQPQIVPGDLSDAAALRSLTDGAEVVVHCAGAIRAEDLAGFMAVNRDGTARLAETAGDSRFLLVSSLAARAPEISAYAASKRAAESVAAEIVDSGRLTVVRPPAIYGPGDRETLTLFLAAARSPVLPRLSAKARMSLMHVEDAAAHIAALAQRPPTGAVYTLADDRPEGYGWDEVIEFLRKSVGKRPLAVPFPPGALGALTALSGLVSRMNGLPPMLSADKARELSHLDRAVRRHELAPNLPPARYGLEAGFASTASWYRHAGWLR
jgi:nucleoside-diphosphate-sugar epimerase